MSLEKSTPLSAHVELLREMYAHMVLTRLLDTCAWQAYQAGRLGFVASCRGHEAAQVGSALCIEVGQDFTLPYYRDVGVVLTIGMTPYEVLRTYLQALQAPASQEVDGAHPQRSRQQPVSHWGYHKHNLVTGPAPVATQIMHAAGIAFACKLRKSSAVTVAYCGDGATAEADFREGVTFAAHHQLPALFLCEQDCSTSYTPIAQTLPLPPELHVCSLDGSDVLAVYTATQEAMQRARSGQGPSLLELCVTRALPDAPISHDPLQSISKVTNIGSTHASSALHAAYDPLQRCVDLLIETQGWDEVWARELHTHLSKEIEQALADVLNSAD